ncbi:MAG: response regulator transcription factor [Alicyclobacillaceae bacterium]|nr:response regulator transcription factor [Alicyclobacillaceae bacterium]
MIRIVMAEDQTLVRQALVRLLNYEEDFDVIAEAGDGTAAIKAIETFIPDIALLDVEMPSLSGLDVAAWVSEHVPTCQCIVVTTFARPGYIQRALQGGARGYLLKDANVRDLAEAIRTVAKGGKVVSPELMFHAWEFKNPLSSREQEILRVAATGCNTRAIAQQLCLSEGTVRNYLSDILGKLNASSRHEATLVAKEQGWL